MRRTNPDQSMEHQQVLGPDRDFFTDAASPDLRARIIADMRALADFLEEHSELPVSPHTSVDVSYFPRTSREEAAFEEVAEAGARLGRMPVWEGEHYVAEHAHGAGRYRIVAIPARTRARYRAWLTYTGHVRQD